MSEADPDGQLQSFEAEAALAREAARLGAAQLSVAVHAMQDGLVIYDAQGRMVLANEAQAALFGLTKAALEGVDRDWLRSHFRLEELDGTPLPPDRWPGAEVLRGAVITDRRVRVRRLDGAPDSILSISGGPVPDASGAPAMAVMVTRDITAASQAEDRLRTSEARLRHFVEHAPAGVAMFDLELRYVAASRRWLAEHHAPGLDVIGRRLYELTPGLPEAWRDVHRHCLAGAVEARDAEARRMPDGSTRWVRWECRPWYDGPRVGGLVIVSEDVTDRRRLEAQLRQAQKLDGLGRLAGGVAHDFNNLLTVILSCAGELARQLPEAALELREEVAEIRGAAERARDLTRQLLLFARRQEADAAVVDLNEALGASERLLRRALGERVRLEVERQPGLWPVRLDVGQLEQVVLNLALNARDAMPEGGTLRLSTSNAEVGPAELGGEAGRLPGSWVRLTVRDGGSGMPPEVLAHLFEPFFTTKALGKGTGLGLATVHGIVAQAGGHVHVRSALGQGTTFELCFPRAGGPAAERPPAPVHAGAGTVLVVEDDGAVRAAMVLALAGAGYEVLVAADGTAALDLARHHHRPVQLVVADVALTGPSIHQLAVELRALRPRPSLLFVAEGAAAPRGVLEDGDLLLPRPFSEEALLSRVGSLLAGEAVPA